MNNERTSIRLTHRRILFILSHFLIWMNSVWASPYHFTTIGLRSGGGNVDGTNAAARFSQPCGAAIDQAGNLYVSDFFSHTIRKITPAGTNWVVTTIAGLSSYPGAHDGTNSEARFNGPMGIAVDSQTNLFVADSLNHTIRKITPVDTNWVVSTVAGTPGFSGTNDGFGIQARFFSPAGLAVGNAGNIYVADTLNQSIRMITVYGQVRTVAGSAGISGSTDGTNRGALFFHPCSLAVDLNENVYVADSGNYTIRKISFIDSSSWVVSTLAGLAGANGSLDGTNSDARFGDPEGLSIDSTGVLYVADGQTNTIRIVSPSGTNWIVTTAAGQPASPGDSDGTNSFARFNFPRGVVADNLGGAFIADMFNGTIRRMTLLGTNFITSTIAGLASARLGSVSFAQPSDVAADASGNVYVADAANQVIRKLAPAGDAWEVSTLAGLLGRGGTSDGTNSSARFSFPRGIAVDGSGNIFVSDTASHTIRALNRVGTNWVVRTLAGQPGVFGSTDGTNRNALFFLPYGLAVDTVGNLFVADSFNHTIRKLSPLGTNWVVTTIAGQARQFGPNDGTNNNARFYHPTDVAISGTGELYIADEFNSAVRKITLFGTNWVVTTLALPARVATSSLQIDSSGAVFTTAGNAIERYWLEGTNWMGEVIGGAGSAGNRDGTGSDALFNSPSGIALDPWGRLFVSDFLNNSIRLGEPVPLLQIASSPSGVVLSWPAWAGKYFLETSEAIDSTSFWAPVESLAVTNLDTVVVTNGCDLPGTFYRLRK